MEKSNPKVEKKASQFEEFVDYDAKGEAVVLRRSTQHPGAEGSEKKSNDFNKTKSPDQNRFAKMAANRSAGTLRFFGDAKQIAGALKSKNESS